MSNKFVWLVFFFLALSFSKISIQRKEGSSIKKKGTLNSSSKADCQVCKCEKCSESESKSDCSSCVCQKCSSTVKKPSKVSFKSKNTPKVHKKVAFGKGDFGPLNLQFLSTPPFLQNILHIIRKLLGSMLRVISIEVNFHDLKTIECKDFKYTDLDFTQKFAQISFKEFDFIIDVIDKQNIGNEILGSLCPNPIYQQRPFSGVLFLNSNKIGKPLAKEFKKILLEILHEVIHTLGFHFDVFKSFGMLDKIEGEFYLKSKMVLEWSKVHFGDKQEGIILETQNFLKQNSNQKSHFKKLFLMNELMTDSISDNSVISIFTLAALEDLGWYKPDYSKAQELFWGRGIAQTFNIDFAKFSQIPNIDSHLCKQFVPFSCTFDKTAIGQCTNKPNFGDNFVSTNEIIIDKNLQNILDCYSPEESFIQTTDGIEFLDNIIEVDAFDYVKSSLSKCIDTDYLTKYDFQNIEKEKQQKEFESKVIKPISVGVAKDFDDFLDSEGDLEQPQGPKKKRPLIKKFDGKQPTKFNPVEITRDKAGIIDIREANLGEKIRKKPLRCQKIICTQQLDLEIYYRRDKFIKCDQMNKGQSVLIEDDLILHSMKCPKDYLPYCSEYKDCIRHNYCSGNGICHNNICSCNEFFKGTDCSIPTGLGKKKRRVHKKK